jgi:hypothetical protein
LKRSPRGNDFKKGRDNKKGGGLNWSQLTSEQKDIVKQVEYYLSDKNLKKDEFFRALISSD